LGLLHFTQTGESRAHQDRNRKILGGKHKCVLRKRRESPARTKDTIFGKGGLLEREENKV